VDEITAVAEPAISFADEGAAFFGFVFGVEAVVFLEFVGAMGKLAVALVATVAKLHKLPAEFRFFFVEQLIFGSVLRGK
jgi:hypothetical protein